MTNFPQRSSVVTAVSIVALLAGCTWAWRTGGKTIAGLWLTLPQQGDRAMRRHDYKGAAARYPDPFHRGVALYRAGEFKQAAAEFGRATSADSWFNRGNSFVMAGRYEDAIASYDSALKLRAHWPDAENNRAVAVARQKLLHPPNDGSEGTEGQLEADKIVFDNKPKTTPGEHETQIIEGGPLSDNDIQALWLRNVKTSPADFLKAKFAYQLSRQSAEKKP